MWPLLETAMDAFCMVDSERSWPQSRFLAAWRGQALSRFLAAWRGQAVPLSCSLARALCVTLCVLELVRTSVLC